MENSTELRQVLIRIRDVMHEVKKMGHRLDMTRYSKNETTQCVIGWLMDSGIFPEIVINTQGPSCQGYYFHTDLIELGSGRYPKHFVERVLDSIFGDNSEHRLQESAALFWGTRITHYRPIRSNTPSPQRVINYIDDLLSYIVTQ